MQNLTVKKEAGLVKSIASDCGRYEWSSAESEYIRDNVTGRSIYQMRLMNLPGEGFGSSELPEAEVSVVREFHSAVDVIVSDAKGKADAERYARAVAAEKEEHEFYKKVAGSWELSDCPSR